VHLQDVMHVPDAEACYFSVSALLSKGGKIIFEQNGFMIMLRSQQLARPHLLTSGIITWDICLTMPLHDIIIP